MYYSLMECNTQSKIIRNTTAYDIKILKTIARCVVTDQNWVELSWFIALRALWTFLRSDATQLNCLVESSRALWTCCVQRTLTVFIPRHCMVIKLGEGMFHRPDRRDGRQGLNLRDFLVCSPPFEWNLPNFPC